MDYFPDATIEKAREIAKLYKTRGMSRKKWLQRLSDNQFLEIGYGFDDAIKSGRCGHFLHEVQKDADCFSMAGVYYIICKELGFEPKIYWISDMRDVEEGDMALERRVGEHAFISVQLEGKEHLYDPLYSREGLMEIADGKIKIATNRPKFGCWIHTERFFSTLTELSEEEYVDEMAKHQSPEGGRLTLSSAQAVRNHGTRVMIQFLPESSELVSYIAKQRLPELIEVLPSKAAVYELSAPIRNDGTWMIEDGNVSVFFSQNSGWMKDQHGLVHCKFTLPYNIVDSYIRNLEAAAQYSGRKTSLRRLLQLDAQDYYEGIGFGPMGELTKENGVDARQHNLLLDEIAAAVPVNEPEEVQASIDQRAVYYSQKLEARSEDNPLALLYSEERRSDFVDELLPKLKAWYAEIADLHYNTILAQARFRPDVRRLKKSWFFIEKDEPLAGRIVDTLNSRGQSVSFYEKEVDFGIWQTEHPVGSLEATDEQRETWYRCAAHRNITRLVKWLPALELKKYQPGLKRILAESI